MEAKNEANLPLGPGICAPVAGFLYPADIPQNPVPSLPLDELSGRIRPPDSPGADPYLLALIQVRDQSAAGPD